MARAASGSSCGGPSSGMGLTPRPLAELSAPADLHRFDEFADSNTPCVLRGLAADWPAVARGRFDPTMTSRLRRHLGEHVSRVSVAPHAAFFDYDVPPAWSAGLEEEATGPTTDVPCLLNPGQLRLYFEDFLDVCEWKRRVGHVVPQATATNNRKVHIVNALYDDECEEECSVQRRSNGMRGDRPPEEKSQEVPVADLAKLALYCVDDAAAWPAPALAELLGTRGADPAADLRPAWIPFLRERRFWMCAGGPSVAGSAQASHVTAGFHWDHMQNIHVVLSGRKELFLVPPLAAPALHATRFCRQAQWRVDRDRVVLAPMSSEESSSDYAVVHLDEPFEVNAARVPALRDLQDLCQTTLHPGDAIYIPPGWWHSVRTWPSTEEERGLPFALSVNFWYALDAEASAARKSELFTLYVLSCQRAMAGVPERHIGAFLEKLGLQETHRSRDQSADDAHENSPQDAGSVPWNAQATTEEEFVSVD